MWKRMRARISRMAHASLTYLARLRRRPETLAVPGRFPEAVALFRLQRPEASPGEWEAFALGLAAAAYDQGLARGADRARGVSPEEERRRHDWSAGDGRPALVMALAGRDPADPLRDVSQEDRRRFAEEISRAVAAGVELRLEVAPPGPHHRPHGRIAS